MAEKQWYSPHAIEARYSKPQIKWLMPYMSMLEGGVYPRNPKETGYVDAPSKSKTINIKAPFQKAVDIHAELSGRIERAGVDGLMLEFLYSFENTNELFVIEHMAQCLNLEVKEVSRRIRSALYFVSGADRKAGSYATYVRQNYATLSSHTDKRP